MLDFPDPRHVLAIAATCALAGVGEPWPALAFDAADADAATPVAALGHDDDDLRARLARRNLLVPVAGVAPAQLRDTFGDARGDRAHGALDIPAERGTPVLAADDGRVVKLFRSVPGGLTVYEADRAGEVVYYYAHLDAYADGLREGDLVARGQTLGYVGTTGNAPPAAPHLHFEIQRLPPGREWWKGVSLDPYPLLTASARHGDDAPLAR